MPGTSAISFLVTNLIHRFIFMHYKIVITRSFFLSRHCMACISTRLIIALARVRFYYFYVLENGEANNETNRRVKKSICMQFLYDLYFSSPFFSFWNINFHGSMCRMKFGACGQMKKQKHIIVFSSH